MINNSYAQYTLENKLNRPLQQNEKIVFLDGDSSNVLPENLSSNVDNKVFDSKETALVCPTCDKEFVLTLRQLHMFQRKKSLGKVKTGPYCSIICAARVVHGNQPPKSQEMTCVGCNKKFTIEGRQLAIKVRNIKLGCKGPFCNKSCASKWQHRK